MKRVVVTIGTRPEAIKMAPVVKALRARPQDFDTRVLFTGQHRELLDQMAEFFDLRPDDDLRVMQQAQSLSGLTARLLMSLDEAIGRHEPDLVLTQGDTTTVLATALTCFYRKIDVGHVEAGLRTNDLRRPFPEEGNRRLTSQLTRYHFAPTQSNAANLRREGVAEERIHVTGNTVIDALLDVAAQRRPAPFVVAPDQRVVLLTLHRGEIFGEPFLGILRAVRRLLEARPDVLMVYPMHPNPEVRRPAREILGATPNVRLMEPLGYGEFVAAMQHATIILSDSGGVQEEAPSLGVPVLVLRDRTERPEGVAAGVARLVGTDGPNIEKIAGQLLDDAAARQRMTCKVSPYGDGEAAQRIISVLLTH
jgi:UDP-N-acetylglucosamine 2-epimerase (non-hydrolysing)